MALYIDREELPEVIDMIPNNILEYVLMKHRERLGRLELLHNAYMGKNIPPTEDIQMVVNYPKYIVDILAGMYLGDPVRYSTDRSQKHTLNDVTVSNGKVTPIDDLTKDKKHYDIEPLIDVFNRQCISDVDMIIGRDLGEFGEAYELEYASDEDIPMPKSAVCSPLCSVMVRDTTRDHNKLFFVTYQKQETVDRQYYYDVYVYTDNECIRYRSDGINTPLSFREVEREPHFFREVPAVEYQNNDYRQGDFESVLSVCNSLNELMSERVSDKKKFVEAVLLFYGMSLTDEQLRKLDTFGIIDQLPTKQDGAAAEYLQKQLDESGVHILMKDLIENIHKISMTVDMSDTAFGTASGVALKMKLLSMNIIIKRKILSMEHGIKKRLEMYINWMVTHGDMEMVDKENIDVIFTTSLPTDESILVNMVTSLQNIVDDETLLGLLPFVKDPAETIKRVKIQKQEDREDYMDTFGFKQKENTVNAEDGNEDGEGLYTNESGSVEEYSENTGDNEHNRRLKKVKENPYKGG